MPFYAQQKVAAEIQRLISKNENFQKFEPLTPADGPRTTDMGRIVNNASFASLRVNVLNEILSGKPAHIELAIPYNGSSIVVQLYRSEVLAPGFHLDTNTGKDVAFEPGIHYRGIVKGDNASLASFSFFRNAMSGIVSAQGFRNLTVHRMRDKASTGDYIIYSDAELTIPVNFNCAASDAVDFGKKERVDPSGRGINGGNCVTVYFEIDHDIYLQNGSDITQTENWMEGLFNNIQTLFANDGIAIALQSASIWVTPDPYSGTTSYDYLEQFGFETPFFDGDVGQLIGIDPGGLGGLAYIDALCFDGYNISYVDVDLYYADVPLFSWTVEAMTHEFGHLLGSPHTHACFWNGNNTPIDGCGDIAGYPEGDCPAGPLPEQQGTIMSYCHLLDTGINLANGFGIQPATLMQSRINASFCLGSDCALGCPNTVSGITVSETSPTTAVLSWTDVGGGPWEVAFTDVNGTFTNWMEVTQSTVNIEGMTANAYYKFAVRPLCADGAGISSQVLYASGTDWCEGAVFTDAGGFWENYSNNQNIVRTFRPSIPGEKIIVSFDVIVIEEGYDFLYVYNGNSTSAPLLAALTGFAPPQQFQSTAADGSLTFEFVSNESETMPGWIANVSCTETTAGAGDITFTNFYYYPNPTGGLVNLSSTDEMGEITVYNTTGQLLLNIPVNSVSATADISGFANGVYFFKVTGSGKEANFRIVKQE